MCLEIDVAARAQGDGQGKGLRGELETILRSIGHHDLLWGLQGGGQVSLSEKWKAFIATADGKLTPIERHIAQSAFYAGAEAMENISSYDEQIHALAEIRQFKLEDKTMQNEIELGLRIIALEDLIRSAFPQKKTMKRKR